MRGRPLSVAPRCGLQIVKPKASRKGRPNVLKITVNCSKLLGYPEPTCVAGSLSQNESLVLVCF